MASVEAQTPPYSTPSLTVVAGPRFTTLGAVINMTYRNNLNAQVAAIVQTSTAKLAKVIASQCDLAASPATMKPGGNATSAAFGPWTGYK